MPTLFQINTVCNSGSTGRIAENIGLLALSQGWESIIAYGHGQVKSASTAYKIGSESAFYWNTAVARVLDNDGFCYGNNTKRLLDYIKKVKPDVIHLHNLHGFYLNITELLTALSKLNVPIFWTLHDCWSFTGHCPHFEYVGCQKWLTQCEHCPKKKDYPSSWGLDQSRRHYIEKKRLVGALKNLTLVTPSLWLARLVKLSFLKSFPVVVINNGIDLGTFYPRNSVALRQRFSLENKKVILGVTGAWTELKGLRFMVEQSERYSAEEYQVVLVGLTAKQKKQLPSTILGLERTESIDELATLYSMAEVYVNPTLEDNFPTTNLEALACGTPVVTFDTGGSKEAIIESNGSTSGAYGLVTKARNTKALCEAIDEVLKNGKAYYTKNCVTRARTLYQAEDCNKQYMELYLKALNLKA